MQSSKRSSKRAGRLLPILTQLNTKSSKYLSIWQPSERASAEREGQKIAVEIKTFLRPSFVRELEYALGQYILYRNLLSVTEPDRELYLAISDRIYHNFFQQNASQFIVEQNQILLLVVDIQSEVIVQWIR